MYRWRVSIFGKSPARTLGIITAPADEAAATTKAIEYFHVEPQHRFRVVVTKLEKGRGAGRAARLGGPPNPQKVTARAN